MSRISREQRRSYRTIVWGLVLILAAVVLILNGLGISFGFGITPWRIIIGVLLLAWLIYEIIRLKFSDIIFPIAFLFLVFQGPIAKAVGYEKEQILSPWIVLLAAFLLSIGVQTLFKRKSEVIINGHTVTSENKGDRIGNHTVYFDATDLSDATIREHLGTVDVYFSNADAYPGDGKITVTENLGMVKLHLPNEWNVVTYTKGNLGKISIPDHEVTGDKNITIAVTENLGEVSVVFEG